MGTGVARASHPDSSPPSPAPFPISPLDSEAAAAGWEPARGAVRLGPAPSAPRTAPGLTLPASVSPSCSGALAGSGSAPASLIARRPWGSGCGSWQERRGQDGGPLNAPPGALRRGPRRQPRPGLRGCLPRGRRAAAAVSALPGEGFPQGHGTAPSPTTLSTGASCGGQGVTPAPLSSWMPSASFFATRASVSPLGAAPHGKGLSVGCCLRWGEVPGDSSHRRSVSAADMGPALRPPGRDGGCTALSWWPFQGDFSSSHRGGGRRG